MKKEIKYSTPKYIQQDVELKKYQYQGRSPFLKQSKKSKICKKTKKEHKYHEVVPNKSDWWYKWWIEGGIKEYQCLCGKKKTDFIKSIFSII